MSPPDVVIIGGGLMGAASAYALARRSVPVLLVEQYAPGHVLGSSHGAARIVRRAYSDPLYVALTGQAFDLWSAVSADSGADLIRFTGGLDFGPGRDVASIAAHLTAAGVEHEVLAANAAADRWPGMRFEGDVVFHPQAGTLDADAAITAMLGLATRAGAQVRHTTAVTALAADADGDGVRVTLADGSPLRPRQVVVAAGAWLEPLLGGLVTLPPLHVTQQQVFHFPRLAPDDPPWPSAIHESSEAVYHLAGGGVHDDRKLGAHTTRGPVTTAAGRSSVVDDAARAAAIDYVQRWLPGLSAEPRDAITCLYTTTPSEDFVLDRVGPVVVCSPCSGHGAKFAPLIGELVAGLVTGSGAEVTPRFRLAAHLSGRTGAVSL